LARRRPHRTAHGCFEIGRFRRIFGRRDIGSRRLRPRRFPRRQGCRLLGHRLSPTSVLFCLSGHSNPRPHQFAWGRSAISASRATAHREGLLFAVHGQADGDQKKAPRKRGAPISTPEGVPAKGRTTLGRPALCLVAQKPHRRQKADKITRNLALCSLFVLRFGHVDQG
jgi:hypothetical protein